MASTPSCIAIWSKDLKVLPIESALVVVKQLFQYGVREITVINKKIYVYLIYTPRQTTILKKFGNLPINYERCITTDPNEQIILNDLKERFKFNLSEEDEVGLTSSTSSTFQQEQRPPASLPPLIPIAKTTLQLPQKRQVSIIDDKDEETNVRSKKTKKTKK